MTPITPYLLKIALPDPHDRPVFAGFLYFCVLKKYFFRVSYGFGNAPSDADNPLKSNRLARA